MRNPKLEIGDIVFVITYARHPRKIWCVVVRQGPAGSGNARAAWLCGGLPADTDLLLEEDPNVDTYTVPPHDQIPDDVWRAIVERALLHD